MNSKLNRRLHKVELTAKLLQYTFLDGYDRNIKLYNKRKQQIEFMLKYKNHKFIVNW